MSSGRAAAVRSRHRRNDRIGVLIIVMAREIADSSGVTESVYVVRRYISLEALTTSLQALLPSRHSPIVRRRFTVLDTFDGRIQRAGAYLTQAGLHARCTITWQPPGGRRHLLVPTRGP